MRAGLSRRAAMDQALIRRRDLGNKVAYLTLVWQGLKPHLARFEPRRAGMDHLSIEQHHAFLAGIGVDAGIAEGQTRIGLDADAPKSVEHRLARFVGHLEARPGGLLTGLASFDEERSAVHCAACLVAPCVRASLSMTRPEASILTNWLARQYSSGAGKSSLWCAPRLS